jgi:ribosomal protein L24E
VNPRRSARTITVTGTTFLFGVECASSCLAVGQYIDSASVSHGVTVTIPSLPFAGALSAGQWIGAAPTQYSNGGPTSGLQPFNGSAAACPSAECYVSGALNNGGSTGNGYIASMSGGVPGELIDLGLYSVVTAVACVTASLCYAGGSAPSPSGLHPTPALWVVSTLSSGGQGYWLASSDGTVTAFGNATSHAFPQRAAPSGVTRLEPAALALNSPIVGIAATPDKGGYWLAGGDGGIFAYGDAPFNRPIVGIAANPAGHGYWEVASDGGIFAFGGAQFYGSMGGTRLNQPVTGIVATPDGKGYWEVAADGGIFSFGDARFEGSTGSLHLNQPIVGLAATSNGLGYWLVAKDGGIFAFGDAHFFGSTGGTGVVAPITAMLAAPDGAGYLLASTDGSVFAFRDAGYFGSLAGKSLSAPIVGIAGS